jgi:ADP-dependent phosphofructokinase/glucokinase
VASIDFSFEICFFICSPLFSIFQASLLFLPLIFFHSFSFSAYASAAAAAFCANTSSESLGSIVVSVYAHSGTIDFLGVEDYGSAVGVNESSAEALDVTKAARWNIPSIGWRSV